MLELGQGGGALHNDNLAAAHIDLRIVSTYNQRFRPVGAMALALFVSRASAPDSSNTGCTSAFGAFFSSSFAARSAAMTSGLPHEYP